MPEGTIQTVNVDKGFGFVQPHEGGPDVFFHRTACRAEFDSLQAGQTVEFALDVSADKPRAKFVAVTGARVSSGCAQPRAGRPNRDRRPTGARTAGGRAERVSRPHNNQRADLGRTGGALRGSDRSAGRPRRSREPEVRRPPNCLCGFVTKLFFEEPHGYISSDAGGMEIRFEPSILRGETRFSGLRVGDYVEFTISAESAGTLTPQATFVHRIERTVKHTQTQLSRHPRSRGKKPTWR